MKTIVAASLLVCAVASAQPSIVIDDRILVNGKALAVTTERFLAAESPELVDALVAQRALAPTENPCGQLQAPGSSTFALIRKVIFACSTAGLTSVGVREGATRPVVALSTVSLAAAVPPPVLKVTKSDFQLTVGDAVLGPFAMGESAPKLLAEKIRAARKVNQAVTLQIDDAVALAPLLQILDACILGGFSQLVLVAQNPLAPLEPQVMGSLDRQLVLKVVTANAAEVRRCYDKVLAGFPKLDGKVSLKFVINALGAVSSSVVESSTNPELGSCVAERVKTWVFPRPTGGGVVVVTYPFSFK